MRAETMQMIEQEATDRAAANRVDKAKAWDAVAAKNAEIARLRAALEEISNHWAVQYDHPRKESEMYRGPYGIGVTDGHRACKIIADAALAVVPTKGTSA